MSLCSECRSGERGRLVDYKLLMYKTPRYMVDIYNELLDGKIQFDNPINIVDDLLFSTTIDLENIITLARTKYPMILLQCPGIRKRMITACY